MTDTSILHQFLHQFVNGSTFDEAAITRTTLEKLLDAGLIRRASGSAGYVYTRTRGRPAFVYVLTAKGRRVCS